MGRFETDAMTTADNVTALADSGRIRWLWRGRESEEEKLQGGTSLDQLLDGDWASLSRFSGAKHDESSPKSLTETTVRVRGYD